MPGNNDAPRAVAKMLSALDLDMAPESAGIYAWYAQLGLADEDWKPHHKNGFDLAAGYLIDAVASYAGIHEPSPVHLTGKGTYQLPWTGTLRRSSIADVSEPNEDPAVATHLGELAVHPDVRRLLISLLRAATPVFASPLYIGVATNLRTRLREHMAAYENARAALRQDPALAGRMQFEGESFGFRLAATGLQLDYLQCWVLPASLDAPTDDGSTPSARDVAETAEWILQRIFLPVLGRQ
ncbi:GIY-YIG nuclease family protein [Mycobacteroides abscessus]|uniref:hypothetical protein n=1 Tax=Mycobacteroides abscessus TaxID=36809 RepID=UPI001F302C6C|nr:hypothetical protein [Mycobacteroides abscessus]